MTWFNIFLSFWVVPSLITFLFLIRTVDPKADSLYDLGVEEWKLSIFFAILYPIAIVAFMEDTGIDWIRDTAFPCIRRLFLKPLKSGWWK